MLFYPDQYFYNRYQGEPRRSQSRRNRGGSSQQFTRGDSDEEDAFSRYRIPRQRERESRQFFGRGQQLPDEYVVIDEDELNALRAFRERRQRESQREQLERAQAAKRRAEAEQKAQAQAQARLQAQIEANARAAAREYLRRKQARQQAILEAQQAERARQQRLIMEQLRQQFGLFAVPTAGVFQESQGEGEDEEPQDEQREGITEAVREAIAEEQLAEAQRESQGGQGVPSQSVAEEGAEGSNERVQREAADPIRRLIEALAPYPFFVTTESSDEEEEGPQKGDDEEIDVSRPVQVTFEPEGDGPICETASEESDPAYIEEPDFDTSSANPPLFEPEYESEENGPSLKDRRKERQTSAPVDQLKKAKTKGSRKDQARQFDRRPSADEVGGLLLALSGELQRLKDAYARLSTAPATTDLRAVISRLEAVKIGYGRTEEIYNKLDEVRAGKDERQSKHEIITESVALADKYEKLLKDVYAEKKRVSAASSPASTPAGAADQSDGASEGPAKPGAKSVHQVTLEEVRDESD